MTLLFALQWHAALRPAQRAWVVCDGRYLRDSGSTCRVNPEQIEESVNKSLARLGTDYVDLLQVRARLPARVRYPNSVLPCLYAPVLPCPSAVCALCRLLTMNNILDACCLAVITTLREHIKL